MVPRTFQTWHGTALKWAGIIVLAAWSVVPIIWLLLTSLKTRLEIFATPPKLFFLPNFSSYQKFLSFGANTVLPFLLNSVLVALGTTIVVTILASLAAYAFSRMKFAGRMPLLMGVLATRLFPPITAVVPLFLMMRNFGLLDTRIGLVIIYAAINVPFAIWILKAFFDTIPRELEDSALIDGCSMLDALWYVTARLALPGLAAAATFTFILAWNEFTFALIFTSTHATTMPVIIAERIGEMQVYWQDMSALAFIVALPGLLFGFFMQRYLVSGLTAGAIK